MAPPADDWTALSTPAGFDRCVRASLREVYGYVALLAGDDRDAIESVVTEMYRSLFQAVQADVLESVSLGALRRASRDLWVERYGPDVRSAAAERGASTTRVMTIAGLTVAERAVLVFCHVNGMSATRAADELGLSPSVVESTSARAVARLRGTSDASGRWMRAYFGEWVTPGPRLIDAIVHDLGTPDELTDDEPTVLDQLATVEMSAVNEAPAVEAAAPVDADAPESGYDLPAVVPQTADPTTAEVPIVEPAEIHAALDDPMVTEELDAVGAAPSAPPPRTTDPSGLVPVGSSRGRVAVVAAACLAIAAVGAWAMFIRGGDEPDSAGDTTPSVTTAPGPETTSADGPTTTAALIANTVPPTEAPVSSAPTTLPRPLASPPGAFEPACTPVSGSADARGEVAAFRRIARDPALVLDIPRSVTADSTLPAATRVFAADGGVVVVVSAHADHGFWSTLLSRVSFDGTKVWTACLDESATVVADPDTGELAVGWLGDEGVDWHRLDVTDGTVGATVDSTVASGFDDLAAARSTRRWETPTVWRSDGTRTVMAVNDGIAAVTECTGEDCSFLGYSINGGGPVWRFDDVGDIAVVDDGAALVADSQGWLVIDLSSGEPIGDVRWDDRATFTRTSDVPTPDTYIEHAGGALVVARGSEMMIYPPADAASETVAVALP